MAKKIMLVNKERFMSMLDKKQHARAVKMILDRKVELEVARMCVQEKEYFIFENVEAINILVGQYEFFELFNSFEQYIQSPLAAFLVHEKESGIAIGWLTDYPTGEQFKAMYESADDEVDQLILFKHLYFRDRYLTVQPEIEYHYKSCANIFVQLLINRHECSDIADAIKLYFRWSYVVNTEALSLAPDRLAELMFERIHSVRTNVSSKEVAFLIDFIYEHPEALANQLQFNLFDLCYRFARVGEVIPVKDTEKIVNWFIEMFKNGNEPHIHIHDLSKIIDCMVALGATDKIEEVLALDLDLNITKYEKDGWMYSNGRSSECRTYERYMNYFHDNLQLQFSEALEQKSLEKRNVKSIILAKPLNSLAQAQYLAHMVATGTVDPNFRNKEIASFGLPKLTEETFPDSVWQSMGIKELVIKDNAVIGQFFVRYACIPRIFKGAPPVEFVKHHAKELSLSDLIYMIETQDYSYSVADIQEILSVIDKESLVMRPRTLSRALFKVSISKTESEETIARAMAAIINQSVELGVVKEVLEGCGFVDEREEGDVNYFAGLNIKKIFDFI